MPLSDQRGLGEPRRIDGAPERAAGPAGADPPLSPLTEARLQQAYRYWRQKSAGKPMPRRADIDPTEIPRLLPDVMLVDVLPCGRYRYRLIGTGNAQAQGINATGRYVDEVLPGAEYRTHVIALYDECVRTGRALYSECVFLSPYEEAPQLQTKILLLPLAENGATVNMVLVVQVFFYVDRAVRDRHFIDVWPYKEVAHALL